MKKKDVEKLLGWSPNRAMLLLILKAVREEKISIEEAVSRYVLPHIGIQDDSGRFEYQGKMVTLEEWKKINPLGEYGKIVTIKT